MVGAALGLCLASVSAGAQTTSRRPDPSAVERGKATFRQSCAACHGDDGRGNGPAATALTPRPTNLARLSRQEGGFSASRVEASIKGIDPVVAHGVPGMMVWGAYFLAEANGSQERADARIRDVVAFIESIQTR
jgi:mono/diheme cytochrome c family protein